MTDINNIQEDHCICATCGTQLSHPITAFCINGHDDWLEIDDGIELFQRASLNIGLTINQLKDKIR